MGPLASGGRPCGTRIRGEHGITPAFDAAIGPDPQVAVAVLEGRRHVSEGRPGLGRRVHPAVRIDAQQPTGSRGDPEVLIAVARKAQRRCGSQRGRHPRLRDLRAVPPRHAAVRPDPHLAGRRGEQAVDLQVGQTVDMATDVRPADPEDAGVPAAEPELAVRGLRDRDDEGRQLAGNRDGIEATAAVRQGAVGERREQHPAVLASSHRGNDRARRALVPDQVVELARAMADEADAAEARPQAAIRGGGHPEHRWPGVRARPGVHQPERQPVEAHEALLGADPEVAVRRLGYRVDGAPGESGLAAPVIAQVLGEPALRVERPDARRDRDGASQREHAGQRTSTAAATASTGTAQRRPRHPSAAGAARTENSRGSCAPVRCRATGRRT